MRRSLTALTVATASVLALPTLAAPAAAHGDPSEKVIFKQVLAPHLTGGDGQAMEFVDNVQYPLAPDVPDASRRGQGGTDIEFARIGDRDLAFAGTYYNGLQIVDITDPTEPELLATYDCRILQGDVQVFRQGAKVLATYTADSRFNTFGAASQCGQDLKIGPNQLGTVIIDVTNPADPKSLGFAEVPEGSHNMTVHPSGKYLYNSNSDLVVRTPVGPATATSTFPRITIFDISTPSAPKKVQDLPIPFVPTSLGSESHDITFNEDGTRAYSAALSQTLILNTEDPQKPTIVSQIVDPAVQVSHGSDPITLKSKHTGRERTLLLVSDEQLGATENAHCPGGGVHFYDITGELEKAPKKLGIWFIGETAPTGAVTCTAHVFRMHGDQGLFTIAWYDQGVRVVDVQGLVDVDPTVPFVVSGSGSGIREVGSYVFADHNTWSFKTNKIESDGSFYGFGNDLGRGLDVYRFDGSALGRTVPALEPVSLMPNARIKKAKKSELLPFLPVGGDGPAAAGLLVLLGAGVLGANVALLRRRAGAAVV